MFISALSRFRSPALHYSHQTWHVRQCQSKVSDQAERHLFSRPLNSYTERKRNYKIEYNDAPESQVYLLAMPTKPSINDFGHEIVSVPFSVEVITQGGGFGGDIIRSQMISSLPICPKNNEEFAQINYLIHFCQNNALQGLIPGIGNGNKGRLLLAWLEKDYKNPFYMARYLLGDSPSKGSHMYTKPYVYAFREDVEVSISLKVKGYENIESIPTHPKTPTELQTTKKILRFIFHGSSASISFDAFKDVEKQVCKWAEARHANSLFLCHFIINGDSAIEGK